MIISYSQQITILFSFFRMLGSENIHWLLHQHGTTKKMQDDDALSRTAVGPVNQPAAAAAAAELGICPIAVAIAAS